MAFNPKIKYFHSGLFIPSKLRRDNIDRLSTALVPRRSKVLELGCATGFMSRYFRRQLHCQVVGVDLNPAAKPTLVGDLNLRSTWNKIKALGQFDVVFASAVIEHLIDPEATLQLIKLVLKPKGKLIITTANIAHWRQRFNLLLGHFDYTDYGTLDRTHLKFYTYYTFQRLIQTAGFKLKTITIDPAGGLKYFNWLAKYWLNFYAHQVCIEAVNH